MIKIYNTYEKVDVFSFNCIKPYPLKKNSSKNEFISEIYSDTYYSDAIVLASEHVNQRLLNYAQNSGKPIMPYAGEDKEAYLNFYNGLLEKDEE